MGRLSKAAVAVVAIALLIAGGGIYALASSGGGTITVCVSHKGGTLYKAHKCAKHDKKLTWSKRGPAGSQGAQGPKGAPGPKGDTGGPGPTASAYAQDQNTFNFVKSSTDTVAVQLTANGGSPLTVGFPARLHVNGVVRLRNNTGSGNTDQTGCRPQIAPDGGTFTDAGPEMLGLTNGYNSFNDEATIALVGEKDVSPGSYDARIVCVRTYSTGATEQNKFNGDAISVIAVAR